MTNKELHAKAFSRLRRNADTTVITSFYIFMLPIFVLLVEGLIYVSARLLNREYSIVSLDYYQQSPKRLWFLIARLFVYFVLLSPQMYLIRRYFISLDSSDLTVQQYISKHMKKILLPGLKCSLKLLGLKLLVLSPIMVGIYGIYYFRQRGSTGDITIFGMLCFMLSIGFTIVWAGVTAHYYLSLSLVKYISELNPRADFFDACDLSIKLMDGKQYRLASFYISLMRFVPLTLLFYPLLGLVPFFIESKLLLAEDIMGEYWQDKLLAMAKRWEKQQLRQGKA
jgi:hypothetical protein